MAERTNHANGPGETRDAAGDRTQQQPVEASTSSLADQKSYHPTSAFRRILDRGRTQAARESNAKNEPSASSSSSSESAARGFAPGGRRLWGRSGGGLSRVGPGFRTISWAAPGAVEQPHD